MRDDAFACLRRVGVETGGSNVQFAVEPVDRPAGHHRDEPPGVALLGAGLEGHRLPDRQDRGAPRRRLPARRDPQRHHEGDAGVVRAHHRLRGHQDPALGLREASRGRRSPRHPHAVGGRGHGHRPHLLRVAAEGAALARAGPRRAQRRPGRGGARRARRSTSSSSASPSPPPSASSSSRRRCGGAPRSTRSWTGPASTPGSSTSWTRIVAERRRIVAARRRSGRPTSAGPSGSGSPTRSWPTCAARPRRTSATAPPGARRAGDVQDGRHLRGRVRGLHAVPLRHLRGGGRGAPSDARPRRSSSGRDRTGSGRASSSTTAACTRPCAARRRLRDGDGQLQPRDGLDRLRHLGPPLLRAADRRGRGQRARRRAGRRRDASVGVIVVARRADPAQAGRIAPARARARDEPGLDRPGRGPRALERALRRARHSPAARRHRHDHAEALAVAREVGYPVLLRPSYVLGGRAMEIVYDDDGVAPGHAGADDRRAGPRGRGHGRAARARRPLLGGRDRGRRRRRSRPRRRGPHRGGHGARRGGGRALGRLGLRAAAPDAARRGRRPARARTPGPSPTRSGSSASSTCSSP